MHYARRVIAEQPRSAPGEWNRMDWRPLDGFVTAITPFNFTAIAGNLPTVPALMGNTVVWKPTPTQQVAAHHTMRLLEAAGLPAGVINMVTGDGLAVSRVALTDPDMASLHLHRLVGDLQDPLAHDRGQPRPVPQLPADRRRDRRQGLRRRPPVGGPGAADHRARPRRLRLPGPEVLGRFASIRAPQRLAGRLRDELADVTRSLRYGDVTT